MFQYIINLRKCISLAILLLIYNFQIGCISAPIPNTYKPFFQLTEQQQCEKFSTYTISQQIDLAMISYSHTHPRSRKIHRWIASKGEQNILSLIEQINTAKDEYRQKHIIEIFEIMATEYYDIQSRQDVISTIKTIISRMQDKSFRQQSEQMLFKIEQKYNIPLHKEGMSC